MEKRFDPFGIGLGENSEFLVGVLVGAGYISRKQKDDLNVLSQAGYSWGCNNRQILEKYYYPFLDGSGKINNLPEGNLKKLESEKTYLEKVSEALTILDYNLRSRPLYNSRDYIRCGISYLEYGVDAVFEELQRKKREGVNQIKFRDISFGRGNDVFYVEFDLQKSETRIYLLKFTETIKEAFLRIFYKKEKVSFLAPFSKIGHFPFHDVTEVIFLKNSPHADKVECEVVTHDQNPEIYKTKYLNKGYFGM